MQPIALWRQLIQCTQNGQHLEEIIPFVAIPVWLNKAKLQKSGHDERSYMKNCKNFPQAQNEISLVLTKVWQVIYLKTIPNSPK